MWHNYRIVAVSLNVDIDVKFTKLDLFLDLPISPIHPPEVNLMTEKIEWLIILRAMITCCICPMKD